MNIWGFFRLEWPLLHITIFLMHVWHWHIQMLLQIFVRKPNRYHTSYIKSIWLNDEGKIDGSPNFFSLMRVRTGIYYIYSIIVVVYIIVTSEPNHTNMECHAWMCSSAMYTCIYHMYVWIWRASYWIFVEPKHTHTHTYTWWCCLTPTMTPNSVFVYKQCICMRVWLSVCLRCPCTYILEPRHSVNTYTNIRIYIYYSQAFHTIHMYLCVYVWFCDSSSTGSSSSTSSSNEASRISSSWNCVRCHSSIEFITERSLKLYVRFGLVCSFHSRSWICRQCKSIATKTQHYTQSEVAHGHIGHGCHLYTFNDNNDNNNTVQIGATIHISIRW